MASLRSYECDECRLGVCTLDGALIVLQLVDCRITNNAEDSMLKMKVSFVLVYFSNFSESTLHSTKRHYYMREASSVEHVRVVVSSSDVIRHFYSTLIVLHAAVECTKFGRISNTRAKRPQRKNARFLAVAPD